jgi:hypothetical protein
VISMTKPTSSVSTYVATKQTRTHPGPPVASTILAMTSLTNATLAEEFRTPTPPARQRGHITLLSRSDYGRPASTATVYCLFAKQLRDSGLPADVLVGKLSKDISFALRRGTVAQVTTHALDGYARPARRRW